MEHEGPSGYSQQPCGPGPREEAKLERGSSQGRGPGQLRRRAEPSFVRSERFALVVARRRSSLLLLGTLVAAGEPPLPPRLSSPRCPPPPMLQLLLGLEARPVLTTLVSLGTKSWGIRGSVVRVGVLLEELMAAADVDPYR